MRITPSYIVLLLCLVLGSPVIAAPEPPVNHSEAPETKDDTALDLSEAKKRSYSIRVGGGFGSNEHLLQILTGDVRLDSRYTGIANLELGTPIAENVWNAFDFVAKIGYIRHFEQGNIPDHNEYTASVKAYFHRFPWRNVLETRLGLAEGISYADRIPFLERETVQEKKLEGSHLLNHLDVSLDVNLGMLSKQPSFDRCYVGVAVSHRSGVFGKVGIFNNFEGASSNYNMAYIECKTS